ncbi:hypothetical protein TNCV_2172141 [Trichonephila clavipes]|nr:hypothetical protein TNCV_2172141 [Trichonephila clavipes]
MKVNVFPLGEVSTRITLVHFDSSLKRTRLHSCGIHNRCFHLPNMRYILLDAVKGTHQTGRKGQSLQNGFRLFAWKFFQTQQKGHEQTEKPLFSYIVVRSIPNSDPVLMSMLCGDLGQSSW